MSDAALNNLARAPKSFNHHRLSQNEFYRSCLQHLKANNRTWTALIDTDEFLAIKTQALHDTSVNVKKPGIVMDMLKASHQENQTLIDFGKVRARGVEKAKIKWGQNCIGVSRVEITSFESKREEVLKDVPSFLDGYQFVTTRFRHVGGGIDGKSLIDVSKYNITASSKMHVHNVIGECSGAPKGDRARGDIMYFNHYIGSFELFDRPNDKRSSKFGKNYRPTEFFNKNKKWNTSYAKSGNFGKGDEIRPWLQAFVDYVGREKSYILLEDVGLPYNESTALQPPSE
jgi:hypothetical protein